MRTLCLLMVAPLILGACDVQPGGSLITGTLVGTRPDGNSYTANFRCSLTTSPPSIMGTVSVTGVGSAELRYAQQQTSDTYHELNVAQFKACQQALTQGDVAGYENAQKALDDYRLAIRRAKTIEEVEAVNQNAKGVGGPDSNPSAVHSADEAGHVSRDRSESNAIPSGTRVTVYLDPAKQWPPPPRAKE